MPAPVTSGTFVFITIAAVVIGSFYLSSKKGMITNDSFQVIAVVTTTLAIATWMMWLCAWMHQWHPLIHPVYEAKS